MTPETLEALIRGGETLDVEFKGEERKPLSDRELAKALGAIEANGRPMAVWVLGLLLFGREEALRRHLTTHHVAFEVLHGIRKARLKCAHVLSEMSGLTEGLEKLLEEIER